MHARDRVAHAHGVPCVAMVAGADGHEIGASVVSAFTYGCLYRHFHGHFHSHGAGIGIKYVVHRVRCHFEQHFAETYGRVMRKAAEHHMAHVVQLALHGCVQPRMVIAVACTPPRRHAVDKLGSVGKFYCCPVRRIHFVGRQRVDG